MTILRAKHLLPISEPPVEDGAVVIQDGTIQAVGPAADIQNAHPGEVRDLGDVILLPGLINAHCHLDYTNLAGQVGFHGSFIQWIEELVELKNRQEESDYLSAVETGFQQLLRSGTTTVVNVESFPGVIDQVSTAALRTWWAMELIDFRQDRPVRQVIQEILDFIDSHPALAGQFALSPHAPYSASGDLYRLASHASRSRHLLVTTHLAESAEEDDMFRRGAGPMYDFFRLARRDMSDCRRVGVVDLLAEYGFLGPHCLAVHANFLTNQDRLLLRQTGSHVVHCPRSHRFFNRGTPTLELLWEQGINVCLGTDSLASHPGVAELSLFEEMQTMARVFPRMSAERILGLATTCAAAALGQQGKLGCIAPVGWADLIAVSRERQSDDLYEEVVFNDQPVAFSMVAGNVLIG